jgi:hypothetical protein
MPRWGIAQVGDCCRPASRYGDPLNDPPRLPPEDPGDAALEAETNRPGTLENILAEPDLRALGDRRLTASPMPWRPEARVP